MIDKLDLAISKFEDEESEIPFSKRLSDLRSAWLWNAFEAMKDIKQHGTNSKMSDEKMFIQENGIKQFMLIEKLYNSELKAGKAEGKKQNEIDLEWLKKIKETDSTMGSIVRDMREPLNKEKTA